MLHFLGKKVEYFGRLMLPAGLFNIAGSSILLYRFLGVRAI